MADDFEALYEVIGHRFADPGLLVEAFTHPSCDGPHNYQRLEFLGDRVLGASIAMRLLEEYPDFDEGNLAIRYNELVRRKTLAKIAKDLQLDTHLRLSPGENDSGGRDKPAILADCCEALIGALFLDAGFDAARAFVDRQWTDLVTAVADTGKDAKTRLQEWAQGRGLATPSYQEVSRTGPAHEPEFVVSVVVGKEYQARGVGGSKRNAEQAAARTLLEQIGVPK
ncbi:MAG: ribonuclease III [Alphaproteobacteria bacterium]